MVSRWWYGRRRTAFVLGALLLLGGAVLLYSTNQLLVDDLSRSARLMSITALRQSLLLDPGSRCNFPDLPVNSSNMMKFVKQIPPIVCTKEVPDWAECIGHTCKLKPELLSRIKSVTCHYTDVLWETDFSNTLGDPVIVKDGEAYTLKDSDFVEVSCQGEDKVTTVIESWSGSLLGIRDSKEIKSRLSWEKPNGQAMRYNVLMFGFDSLSRNTFIRKLPKSYNIMKDELKAHVLEGYNIVGDGTPQALIPILTGSTELELPETRKRMGSKANYVNVYPLVWKHFSENGYATAFHEDTPNVGIFTYRLKGFGTQPTDHYMRSYLIHTEPKQNRWTKYCNGNIPRHKLMLDYTKQFMNTYQDSPRFAFGFHGELSHDNYNLIQAADDDLAEWLRDLKSSGILDNTILILMSDHGHRFASIRNTLQGKQEERLPWFSFVLPPDLNSVRPGALDNFKDNTKRLTTPFDIHATLMDILGMNPNENYDVKSKFPPRSLSLFGPISVNRTCGQAGIEPHWCACLTWRPVSLTDPIAKRLADSLVDSVNKFVSPFSDRCAELSLEKIEWVTSLAATDGIIGFKQTIDKDGFMPDLSAKTVGITKLYQIKVRLSPGGSLFEASLSHNLDSDGVSVKLSDVSRINKYGDQARCIYDSQPQLRKYCFCTRD